MAATTVKKANLKFYGKRVEVVLKFLKEYNEDNFKSDLKKFLDMHIKLYARRVYSKDTPKQWRSKFLEWFKGEFGYDFPKPATEMELKRFMDWCFEQFEYNLGMTPQVIKSVGEPTFKGFMDLTSRNS